MYHWKSKNLFRLLVEMWKTPNLSSLSLQPFV
jgi:hypothetical protein